MSELIQTVTRKGKDLTHEVLWREKEGDLTQSYDKNPHNNRNLENQWTIQKPHQNFDYTTIAYRLRTVTSSNNSHRTGVVKPVYGYPTFPLT